MWGPWFIVLAALLALAVLTGWDDEESEPRGARAAAPVAVIAERVAAIRGQAFEAIPRPLGVTPAEAKAEALAVLDEEYPPPKRRADMTMLRLLGLVREEIDFEEIYASIFESQVAGYYDTVNKRLRIVEDAAASNGTYTEIILAHELTHALEDQVFELRIDEAASLGDEGLAYTAFVEGTATVLMLEYGERHFTSEELLAGLLGSAFEPPAELPAFIQASLIFPYVSGQAFAQQLYRAAGDWTLIDIAHRRRPPASTEQVLHPGKYLRFEEPVAVRIGLGAVLGEGWRPLASGTLGEWQTGELLRAAGGFGAATAAAGWGGDRYQLWSGPDGHVLVVRWVWDSERDRREFAARLRGYVASDAPGAAAAMHVRGGAVTLAIADDPALARRLARAP